MYILLDISLGSFGVLLIIFIGFSILLSIFKQNQVETLNFTEIFVVVVLLGLFWVAFSQFISYLFFGKIIIISCFLPLLLIAFQLDKVKLVVNRFKGILNTQSLIHDNRFEKLLLLILSLYLSFKILFFPPFASDDVWNWHQIAKVFFFSNEILYPSNDSYIAFRSLEGNLLFTNIDSSRSYPIFVPLIYNFFHHIAFDFNLLAVKGFYWIVDLIGLMCVYDLSKSLGHSSKTALITVIILISTPYFFIFGSSGYNDGILGILIFISIWIILKSTFNPIFNKILYPIFILAIMTKLEGLYLFIIIGFALIFLKNKIQVRKFIFSIILLIISYGVWLIFVFNNTGSFFKFGLSSQSSSPKLSLIDFFSFLITLINPFHFPVLLLMFLFSFLLFFQKKLFKNPLISFIFTIILIYLIPWFAISSGPGPRPLAHIIPLIALFSSIGVKELIFFLKTVKRKLYGKININLNFNHLFSLSSSILGIFIVIAAPVFVDTQFPTQFFYDDLYAASNVFSTSEKAYGSVKHQAMHASYLLALWIDEYLPKNSKIAIPRSESGLILFINRHSTQLNHFTSKFSLGQWMVYFKSNGFTHIVFDSLFQYDSFFPYFLSSGYFVLVKSIPYNASVGIYHQKPVYSSLFKINYENSDFLNISVISEHKIPTTQSIANYNVKIHFNNTQSNRTFIVYNTLDKNSSIYTHFDKMEISLNNFFISDKGFPFTFNKSFLLPGLNIIEIEVQDINGVFSFPTISELDI